LALRRKTFLKTLLAFALIGALSVLLIFPVLLSAFNVYLHPAVVAASKVAAEESNRAYFAYDFSSLTAIALHPWMMVLTVASLAAGIIWRNRLILAMALWMLLLWGIGNLYLLNIPRLAFFNYTGIMILYYLPAGVMIAAAVGDVLARFKFFERPSVQPWLAALGAVLAFFGCALRSSSVEPQRYFMTVQDQAGMAWIVQNTPADTTFAVDTYYWLGTSPHGVDAGYWIPYFTGRKTTTGSMNFGLGPQAYVDQVRKNAAMVARIQDDESALTDLCHAGVNYLYIGALRNRFLGSFDPEQVIVKYSDRVVFAQGGAAVIRLCP
jgi:hypothetical protein